jgi:hypothetical protein
MRRGARSSTVPGGMLTALGKCKAANEIGDSASMRTKSPLRSIFSSSASRSMFSSAGAMAEVCR